MAAQVSVEPLRVHGVFAKLPPVIVRGGSAIVTFICALPKLRVEYAVGTETTRRMDAMAIRILLLLEMFILVLANTQKRI